MRGSSPMKNQVKGRYKTDRTSRERVGLLPQRSSTLSTVIQVIKQTLFDRHIVFTGFLNWAVV